MRSVLGPSHSRRLAPRSAWLLVLLMWVANSALISVSRCALGAEISKASSDEASESLRFSFREAPWDQVLSWFARQAELTLDLTDVPPGTFSYEDQRDHTVTEAIDILNGYLLPRGYVTIRRDQFLVVLQTSNAVLSNFIPTIKPGELKSYGDHELLRMVIRVQGVTPSEIVEQVESLLGQHGSATALDVSQSLVIQGFGAGLRDVVAMLAESVVPPTDDELVFRAFALQHTLATDAERQIRAMFGLGAIDMNLNWQRLRGQQRSRDRRRDDDDDDRNRTQSPTPVMANLAMNMKVSVLSRTNTLLVTATPPALELVEEMLQSMDVALDGNAQSVIDDHEPELRVYVLNDADEADVARTLEVVMPGVVINQDSRQDSIHVLATPREHAEVQSIIDIVDQGGVDGEVKVIPLQKSNPLTMSELLQSLFQNEDRDERPMIEPELRTNSLAIRATSKQMVQIRKTLAAYGETWEATESPTATSRIRKVTLPGINADHVARAVKDLLAEDHQFANPIRIVVPSEVSVGAPDPTIDEAIEPDSKSTRRLTEELLKDESVMLDDNAAWNGDTCTDEVVPPVFAMNDLAPKRASMSKGGRVSDTLMVVDRTANADEPPRVTIEVRDDELLMYSNDGVALDQVEATILELVRQMPVRTNWTVFYLRAANATDTAAQLAILLEASSSTRVGVGYPTAEEPLLAGEELAVRIVADSRINALFVSGPSDKVEAAARFLKVLDSSDLPPLLSERTPRAIPLQYADASAVAAMVRELYADYLEDPAARARERARGNRNEDDRRREVVAPVPRNGSNRPVGIRLTLAVDVEANELLVSCSDALHEQISRLVAQRDQAAADAQSVVEVAHVGGMNAGDVAAILDGLYPQITVTTTETTSTRRPRPATSSRSSRDTFRRSEYFRNLRSRAGSFGGRNTSERRD